jgi:hypothetical protein
LWFVVRGSPALSQFGCSHSGKKASRGGPFSGASLAAKMEMQGNVWQLSQVIAMQSFTRKRFP